MIRALLETDYIKLHEEHVDSIFVESESDTEPLPSRKRKRFVPTPPILSDSESNSSTRSLQSQFREILANIKEKEGD